MIFGKINDDDDHDVVGNEYETMMWNKEGNDKIKWSIFLLNFVQKILSKIDIN